MTLDTVETSAEYVVQLCDGGYATSLPLEDVTGRIPLDRAADAHRVLEAGEAVGKAVLTME